MATNIQLYPQDYSLDSCKIVTGIGQPYEFRHVVQEINYYEDIYANYITGDLTINDSTGYLSKLSFNGTEFIILSFSKPGANQDVEKIEKTFRIYKVTNRSMLNDLNESYTLHYCSEEAVLSEQYRVSKSYKNKKVSEMVTDILKNKLKVDDKKLNLNNIEETLNARDIIIPNRKPLEALNWLCTQAISSNSKNYGASYLFFENINGFNFQTLQNLFSGKVYNTYRYEPKNITGEDRRFQDLNLEKKNVINYQAINNFDTLNNTMSGMFSNRLIAIDTIRQRYTDNKFEYPSYFDKAKKLNDNMNMSKFKNRLGDTLDKTYDACLKMVTTNTGQVLNNPYIKSHDPSVKDIKIEHIVPNRTSQLTQMTSIRYKITISGDPLITVGTVIEFELPDIEITTDGRKSDKFYSGKYIVTAVRHQINLENKFLTLLEISKESVPTAFAVPNNDSTAWKNIRSK